METIKDFFEELKNRLTNPFISSFIIAWFVSNWKIPVALILYKQEQLELDGYYSYISLINDSTDYFYSLILPLGLALGYTFGFPYFKAFIKEFHAKINTKSEDKLLEISKDSTIPISKFMKLKNEYETKLGELKKVMQSESQVLEENSNLINTKNDLIRELNSRKEEINQLTNRDVSIAHANDIKVLAGNWIYKSESIKQRWHISNGSIEFLNGPDEGVIYKIEDYVAYPQNSIYAFTAKRIEPNSQNPLNSYFLRDVNGKFRGLLNGNIKFSLEKEDGSDWKL